MRPRARRQLARESRPRHVVGQLDPSCFCGRLVSAWGGRQCDSRATCPDLRSRRLAPTPRRSALTSRRHLSLPESGPPRGCALPVRAPGQAALLCSADRRIVFLRLSQAQPLSSNCSGRRDSPRPDQTGSIWAKLRPRLASIGQQMQHLDQVWSIWVQFRPTIGRQSLADNEFRPIYTPVLAKCAQS